MRYRNFRRRPTAPNNAIEEGRNLAGLGELPEDLMHERQLRPPILTPRGNPTDDTFQQMPAVAAPPPATRNYNPQTLTTYTINVPAGVVTAVFAATRERSYSLIVNSGATDAVITYGREPANATDGIPLTSGGAGFHELINGTVSTCFAFASAATTLIVTEGRFDPPMES